MDEPLLTLEDVLREVQAEGIDLTERTFRYYTVMGLLPKPCKRPSGTEDARVAFYPREILTRLAEIRSLQADGYSLKQIKQFFNARMVPEARPQESGESAEDATSAAVVSAAMQALSRGTLSEVARRFVVESMLHPDEESFRRLAARYYQDALSVVLGEAAGATVRNLLSGMSPLELEALWHPLRAWRDRERARRAQGTARSLPVADHLRSLAEAHASGDSEATAALVERVREDAARLRSLRERVAEGGEGRSPWLQQLAGWASSCLAALEEACQAAAREEDASPDAASSWPLEVDAAEERLAETMVLVAATERMLSASTSSPRP